MLAVAVSSDGRYLAAGGRTKEVLVWDTRTGKLAKTFTGHRDAVSGLAFRADSHALYSASHDRCLKHWNLDEMAYVETLYGHQSDVSG
jgi:ribosomal RNA-processing protein 9